MMKCNNCGKKIDEGSQFCPHCGAKTEENTGARTANRPVKSGGKLPLILAVAVVVIVAVLLFVFLRPKYTTIVPTEYVKVSSKGLNGSGTAKAELDTSSLQAAITEEQKLKPAQQNELESLLEQAAAYFTLSQDTGLSNGDSVAIQCSMPSDYLNAYHVKIKNSDYNYTVSGLTDVQTVKLEDYCTVSFSGFDGHGYAGYYLENEQLYQDISEMIRLVDDSAKAEAYISDGLYGELFYNGLLWQEISPWENLSNEDTVTFTCEVSDAETQLEQYGIVFEGVACEQKVEGLESLETLKLEDYLQVSFEGYDGAGEVSLRLDEEQLAADLAEQFPDGRGNNTAEWLGDIVVDYADDFMSWSVEPKTGLSSGDEVHIQIAGESEENYISSVGFVLEDLDMTVTADGLESPQEADLTDLLQVEFSGIAPNVKVQVSVDDSSPLCAYLDYASVREIPQSLKAYNGDGLEITLDYDGEAALYHGYNIINSSKYYEIEGLDTYDFSLEDTEQENLAQLIGEQKEQSVSLLLHEEETLLQTLGAERVQILWSQVRLGLQKIIKLYSGEAYAYNRMVLVYEAAVPMMNPDETVSKKNAFVIKILENVSEATDGTLSWEWEGTEYFYESEAAVAEFLENLANETWEEECIRTEVINENLEKELAGNTDKDEDSENDIEGSEEAKPGDDGDDASEADPDEDASENMDVEDVAAPVTEAQLQDIQERAVSGVELDGHWYYLFDEAVSWNEAKKLCEQAGGTLATVTGWSEQAALQALIQEGELEHYWIGASDEAMEGVWSWVTGEEFSATYWDSYQPDNNSGVEDYAVISRAFGNNWNDYPAEQENVGYILELQGTEVRTGRNLVGSGTVRHEDGTSYDAWVDDTYGNTHYGAILFHASSGGWAQYELKGAYTRLAGVVSVYSEADSQEELDIAVFGDGKLLWSECGITRQMREVSFDVDVSGVQSVTIATRSSGTSGNGWLILDQAKLYGEQTEAAPAAFSRLSELYLIAGSEFSQANGLNRDTAGLLHEGYMEFDAGRGASAAWNLNGGYTSFEGKLVTYNNTGADVSMNVRIYGDEELLLEEKGINKMSGAIPFEIDVTGVTVLRIETEDTSETGNAWLYIVDDVLSDKTAASGAEENAGDPADGAKEDGDAGEGAAENAEEGMSENAGEGAAENNGEAGEEAAATAAVPANVMALASSMVQYDSHLYFLIETPTTWQNAERFCEQMGGHLAVISSPLVEAQIRNLLELSSGSGYWLGATDEEEEGEWLWVTGEAMTYENWSDGNPDNYDSENGGENYLEIYENGSWNDNNEQEMLGFIMEISPAEAPSDEVELAELQYAGSAWDGADYEYLWKTQDIHGGERLSSYRLDASYGGWITCSLNGAYEKLSGTVIPASGADQNAKMNIAVFGDGKLLWAETELDGWSQELSFEADVKGVRILTIRTSNTGSSGALLLENAVLQEAQEPSLTGRTAALNELQLVDYGALEYRAGLFRDSYGNVYDGDLSFLASENSYAVYLLGGAYTEFSGILVPSGETGIDSSMSVQIYADEELIFETDGITRMTEAIPFTVDVSGTDNLKIVTGDAEDCYDGYLYIVEDALK